jgi:uncharacterized membrane protein (DUF106 family)
MPELIAIEIDWKALGVCLTGGAIIVGIVSRYIAGLLSDKKTTSEHGIRLDNHDDDIKEIKEEMKEFRKWYNRGQNN